MNDSLLVDRLKELGIFALDKTQDLLLFVESEAPDVLQQWVQWNFIASLIAFCIGICIIFSIIIYAKYVSKVTIQKDKYGDEKTQTRLLHWSRGTDGEFGWVVLFWGYAAVGFVTALIVIFNNFDWIKILAAEKVWILENIMSLLGK